MGRATCSCYGIYKCPRAIYVLQNFLLFNDQSIKFLFRFVSSSFIHDTFISKMGYVMFSFIQCLNFRQFQVKSWGVRIFNTTSKMIWPPLYSLAQLFSNIYHTYVAFCFRFMMHIAVKKRCATKKMNC